MDVESSSAFPPLSASNKRELSPERDAPDKTPRTCQNPHQPSDQEYTKASFLLRAVSGARVFNNPSKVSHALLNSAFGKYIIEGEIRSLGNGSALILAVWEHLLPKVPDLQRGTFHLGEWEVTCRRAERDCGDYQYARVGPLAAEADLVEVRDHFRTLDGGEVVELAWIPAHHPPRTTTGKWLRLKVRGTLPTKVSISQMVFWPIPYLLPLLRCPGCQKIGHSINTCRSSVRCSRCSGPHPYKQNNTTNCTRPYHCFQCGGAHGPRSAYCPYNRHAQQVYADMVRDKKPLYAINKQLRDITTRKPQTPREPQHTPPASPPQGSQLIPPAPAPSLPNQPAVRPVRPGESYASVTTDNKFSLLQDPPDEDAILLADSVVTPEPCSPTRPLRYRHMPRHRQLGCQAPPPTPSPSVPEEGPTHFQVEAEVHQPFVPPTRQGQRTERSSSQATPPHPSPTMPTRHPAPPSCPTYPLPGPTSSPQTEVVLSRVFSLLWKGYQLYQKGTSMPDILATLWPTLSMLFTSLFP